MRWPRACLSVRPSMAAPPPRPHRRLRTGLAPRAPRRSPAPPPPALGALRRGVFVPSEAPRRRCALAAPGAQRQAPPGTERETEARSAAQSPRGTDRPGARPPPPAARPDCLTQSARLPPEVRPAEPRTRTVPVPQGRRPTQTGRGPRASDVRDAERALGTQQWDSLAFVKQAKGTGRCVSEGVSRPQRNANPNHSTTTSYPWVGQNQKLRW